MSWAPSRRPWSRRPGARRSCADPVPLLGGAFIASCYVGQFDSLAFGPQTPFLDPDNFVYGPHYPEELKNQSHVSDPVVTDLLLRQRRTTDLARRPDVLADLQRHLARQQYYIQLPGPVFPAFSSV